MALLNEILGTAARYNQLLTRKFNIAGGAPAPQLTPEIGTSLNLEVGPEGAILAYELLASGFITQTATALQPSQIRLTNPSGSNQLVIVEHIEAAVEVTSAFITCGIINSATILAGTVAVGGITGRETRLPASGTVTRAPTARISKDATGIAGAAGNLFVRKPLADTITEYNVPVVLAPGWSVTLVCGTVNLTLDAAFAWREIPLAPGEVGPF